MATFKYIIRKNKSAISKDGKTTIYLRYTHRGKSAYFTTSKGIQISYWMPDSQRVKNSYKGHSVLNAYLSRFRQIIEDIVNRALYDGIDPTSEYVRKQYDLSKEEKQLKQEKEESRLDFESFSIQFIEESKRTKKAPTVRSYNDFLNVLEL